MPPPAEQRAVRDAGLRESLLEIVPDQPALIDARGVLLEEPELFGDAEGCVAVRSGGELLVAVGTPDREALEGALARARPGADLVVSTASAAAVTDSLGFEGERAFVHVVGKAGLRGELDLPPAVLLDPKVPVVHLPAELLQEVEEVLGRRPVGAVIEGGRPVSVCYPVLVTESYWDVSIETLEGYRRGGRAAAAFLRLEREMRREGREPVWGAVQSNTASLALAAKLGFERVGEIRVFDLKGRAD